MLPLRRRVVDIAFSGWRRAKPTIAVGVVMAAVALAPVSPSIAQGTERMSTLARGSFTVRLAPQGEDDARDGVALGRMSLDKTFEGDLVGTGQGQMLTALTTVKSSAGYVAIERVTGTLHGRSGGFVLQHTGVMTGGAQRLSIDVVPDSGTGGLAGIAGVFTLRIEGGKHFYELAYSLPPGP